MKKLRNVLAWHGGNLYLGNYGGTDGDGTII